MTNEEPSTAMIEARGLSKYYGPFVAVQDMSFTIPQGQVVAFLGPNGAGKTTLLKLLAGLLLPNGGRIAVDGVDLTGQPTRLRERVSFAVCDERSFYWRISALENLRFFASLNGFTAAGRDARIMACLELVGLLGVEGRRYMEYSSGMRQSLALARGLLRDPSILLMDEPTRSLDPEATLKIHEVIKGLQARNPERIILYSTHDLAEAESISSDVIVLRQGRIVTQRSLSSGADDAYVYGLRTHPVIPEDLLENLDAVSVLGTHSDEMTVHFADLRVLDAILARIRTRGLRVIEVTQKRSTLGELYLASAEGASAEDPK